MEFAKKFDNTQILVVGGAGFVGSNLVKRLLGESSFVHIWVVDNLLSAEECNIPNDDRVHFLKGSIADDKVLRQLDDHFDYIFHLATYHGNQSSIHNPIADHENNTLTTLKLFDYIKGFKKIKKIVYSGAGCAVAEKTFSEAKASKEVDIVALDADSPYSISKLIGEFYSKYYFKQHQLPVVRARFQNVYGPGEILGAGCWRGTPATVWRNVIPTFIYKALQGDSLPLENEGIATRDFIYVDDIVRGLIYCALEGKSGDVYNLATGAEISIRSVAEQIIALTENRAVIKLLPKRAWDHSGKRFGCPEKAKNVMGFETKVPFPEGLKQTIDWTKTNSSLIAKTIAKHSQYLEKM